MKWLVQQVEEKFKPKEVTLQLSNTSFDKFTYFPLEDYDLKKKNGT